MGLEGRVAIVTGADGGLGRKICEVFEREGAAVTAVDLRGPECLHLDVGSESGNREMIDAALARHGRLDTLVLNAGVQFMAPLPDFATEQWDRLTDVMVKGPFLAIKHAWAALTAKPGGRIIITTSTNGLLGERFKAAYVSAKHAATGLIKVAALEGGPVGLTANAVAPGLMMTPLIEAQMADQVQLHKVSEEEIMASWLSRGAAGRPIDTGEVAEAIAFLASDRASGISGATIPVDLGLLAC